MNRDPIAATDAPTRDEPKNITRRRRMVILFVTAAAAAQLLTACSLSQDITPTGPPSSAASPVLPQRPAGADGPFLVKYVSDGDTIGVDIAGKTTTVRLIGIDTPEVKDPRKPVQCFGQAATTHAHELLDGSQVWLEYDPAGDRKDRCGRTLAYVWLDQSTLVNQSMLTGGFAHEYTYNTPYKYQAAFKAEESAARADGKGLWAADTCAGDTDRPVP